MKRWREAQAAMRAAFNEIAKPMSDVAKCVAEPDTWGERVDLWKSIDSDGLETYLTAGGIAGDPQSALAAIAALEEAVSAARKKLEASFWAWLPHHMRDAAKAADFGTDKQLLGRFSGHTWASDGAAMIRTGPESEFDEAQERGSLAVQEDRMAHVLDWLSADHAPAEPVTAPIEQPVPWLDESPTPVFAEHYVAMLRALYPDATWWLAGRCDVGFLKDGAGEIVAVVMPLRGPS